MDYTLLADELIDLQTAFNHLPVGEALTELYCGEYLALSFLAGRGGAAHPKELSGFMCVSSARIAALLRHLEEKGWVRRKPDRTDERKVVVRLTKVGGALIGAKHAEAVAEVCRLLGALEPDEAAEYVRLRRKLVAAAGKISLKEGEAT